MKKSILLSLFFMLFASFAIMAQDDAEIEELDAPPSLDELLLRPNDIKVPIVDDFKNASFNLYDKVIEARKNGETGGWSDEQGLKVAKFTPEYLKLIKATVIMAKDIKTVPKLKLPFAIKNFVNSKKAISHSNAHIKYMKSQYTAEQMAKYEEMVKTMEDVPAEEPATPAADGDGGK